MEDIKKKVEALLFSSGRRMSLEELSKLCRYSAEEIRKAIDELKKEYEEKKSSLIITDEGDFCKLTTKEDYFHLVKSIVTKTELTKTLTETLAVIAFKYPIKQSDLIKIRTNKAYDHLNELEEMGYITRQKYGRTKLIKLAQKFFDYFSLPNDKLKEQFNDFNGLAKAIESKEEEINSIKEEQKRMAKEAGRSSGDNEKEIVNPSKEVDLVDDKGRKVKLKVINEPEAEEREEPPEIKSYRDTLGGLEVVDEPEIKPNKKEQEKPKEKPKGIDITDDMEEEVDKRVSEILSGESTEEAPAEEEEPAEEKQEENPEEMSDVDKEIEKMMHPEEKETEKPSEKEDSEWGQKQEEPKDLLDASFEEKKAKKSKGEDNPE